MPRTKAERAALLLIHTQDGQPDGLAERNRMKIQLGQTVQDKVTTFTGVVMGRVEYLTGCAQVLVQPPAKDGAWVESRWFDEPRVEALPVAPIVIEIGERPGADVEAPRK